MSFDNERNEYEDYEDTYTNSVAASDDIMEVFGYAGEAFRDRYMSDYDTSYSDRWSSNY